MSNDKALAKAARRAWTGVSRSAAGAGAAAAGADGAGIGLYRDRLEADDRRRYEQALRIEGLSHEIALLRVKIAQELDGDLEAVRDAIAVLARAVATEYRLSQRHQDELYQSILNVVQGLGEAAGIEPPAGKGER